MPPARTVRQKGSITLELIIAFAVASLVLTSVILLLGSNDALAFEREFTERSIAEELIDDARAASTTDFASFASTASTSIQDHIPYRASLAAQSITPCVLGLAAAATSTGRVGDGVGFSAWLADTALAHSLGGDCEYQAATSSWSGFVAQNSIPLAAACLDALNGYEYLGLSASPYFAIVKDGARVAFTNGFALLAMPHSLDAALINGQPYAFAALASSTAQLGVISVRDPQAPVLEASLRLNGITATGTDAEAYHVTYFDNSAYLSTRYIIGAQPELHIVDVNEPSHPFEVGSANIDTTINGMALRARLVGQITRIYLYAATTYDTRELAVYDVTNPSGVSLVSSVDLPGTQDGDSIAIQGNTLYLGRASNTAGPELYAFDISSSTATPRLIGSAEISSKDTTALAPMGSVLFLGATNDGASNRMLEAWDISDPAHMSLRGVLKVPGLVLAGIEYAAGQVFVLDASALHMYVGN